MWMPGEARKIVLRNVIAEVVQQEKWVEFLRVSEAKGTPKMHARTLESWPRFDEPLHWSN
jgi:hypothetical protein